MINYLELSNANVVDIIFCKGIKNLDSLKINEVGFDLQHLNAKIGISSFIEGEEVFFQTANQLRYLDQNNPALQGLNLSNGFRIKDIGPEFDFPDNNYHVISCNEYGELLALNPFMANVYSGVLFDLALGYNNHKQVEADIQNKIYSLDKISGFIGEYFLETISDRFEYGNGLYLVKKSDIEKIVK